MLLNLTDLLASKRLMLALAIALGAIVGLSTMVIDNSAVLIVGAVAIAFGYLALQRLEYGLVVLIFITYIRLSDVLIKFHGAPSVAKFLAVAILLLVLTRWVLFNDQPTPWVRPAITLGLYGLIGFASLLWADNSSRVADALFDYGKDVVIVLVVVMILHRREALNWVVWSLLAAGLFLGSLSTFQFLTGTFDNNYGGFALAELRNIVGTTSDYRLSGPISSNYFALILVALVPFALDRLWHQRQTWLKITAALTLLVMVFSIFFTYSRGGLIALLLVVAIMIAWRRPPLTALLATALLAIVLWQFVPPQYADRMLTILNVLQTDIDAQTDGSIRGRYVETQVALDMFADHPLRGVGLANYNNNYLDYAEHLGLVNRTGERSAHSLYLEILAETGLLGLLVFAAILAAVFYDLRLAFLKFRKVGLTNEAFLTLAMAVSLIGYLTGSIFLHLAYARYFWLLIGLGFAFRNVAEHEAARRAVANETTGSN